LCHRPDASNPNVERSTVIASFAMLAGSPDRSMFAELVTASDSLDARRRVKNHSTGKLSHMLADRAIPDA